MGIREMLKQVIELQDKLNSKIDKDWKKNRTERDFQIATIQEISELINSYPYKWWKKMKDDDFNKKVELVDIFHFLLSWSILVEKCVYENEHDLEDTIYSFYKKVEFLNKSKEFSDYDIILGLLFGVVESRLDICYLSFFELVKRHFNSVEEFLKWYFVKNVLNEIRQIKGYKTGEYKKVIDEIEDNKVIYKLAENIEFTDFGEFKNILVDRYVAHIMSLGVNYYE